MVKPTKRNKDPLCDFNGVCRIPVEPGEDGQKVQIRSMNDISWRIFRIMGEFVQGFPFLSNFNNEISIFGAVRLKPGTHWYDECERFAYMCAKDGFTIITGGGPGIMEAGNKGAFKAGGESLGINIQLPFEQRINPYVKKSMAFHYFFTRKVMLAASAQVYVFFPGGFGTADEFFEMLTLVQTKKVSAVPIICVGKEFWSYCKTWMEKMYEMGTIAKEDINLVSFVDNADEAFAIAKKSKERSFF